MQWPERTNNDFENLSYVLRFRALTQKLVIDAIQIRWYSLNQLSDGRSREALAALDALQNELDPQESTISISSNLLNQGMLLVYRNLAPPRNRCNCVFHNKFDVMRYCHGFILSSQPDGRKVEKGVFD